MFIDVSLTVYQCIVSPFVLPTVTNMLCTLECFTVFVLPPQSWQQESVLARLCCKKFARACNAKNLRAFVLQKNLRAFLLQFLLLKYFSAAVFASKICFYCSRVSVAENCSRVLFNCVCTAPCSNGSRKSSSAVMKWLEVKIDPYIAPHSCKTSAGLLCILCIMCVCGLIVRIATTSTVC